MTDDADRLVQWLREGASELERAHRLLDTFGVPRCIQGTALSLSARIAVLKLSDSEKDASGSA